MLSADWFAGIGHAFTPFGAWDIAATKAPSAPAAHSVALIAFQLLHPRRARRADSRAVLGGSSVVGSGYGSGDNSNAANSSAALANSSSISSISTTDTAKNDRTNAADEEGGELWWWNVLASNVGGGAGGAPVQLAELWPAPAKGTEFWVEEWGRNVCSDKAAASTCLTKWSAMLPLNVQTTVIHRNYVDTDRQYRLFRAAPILPSGWTLVGETSKFVAVSPQRFAVAVAAVSNATNSSHADIGGSSSSGGSDSSSGSGGGGGGNDDLFGKSSALQPFELELLGNGSLAFDVVGAAGEQVVVTLVTPSATILEVDCKLSSSGSARVVCSSSEVCTVSTSL